MIGFSLLEKDEKTYIYVKRYLSYLKNKKGSLLKLQNDFQIEEIQIHLKNHNIKGEEESNIESITWIKHHGDKFRIYLNSLKILALMALDCKCSCNKDDFSYVDFCKSVDIICNNRELVEDIF